MFKDQQKGQCDCSRLGSWGVLVVGDGIDMGAGRHRMH